MSTVILQSHHVIEKVQLESNELLQRLKEAKLFDMDSPRNRLYLPVDGQLADDMESTPHRGRTRSTYHDGLNDVLNDLMEKSDWQDAKNGDEAALKRLAGKVEAMQDTLKVALINGDAFPTTPDRLTKDGANAANRATFGDLDGYAVLHADQIDHLRRMGPVESEWAAVTHNERRVAFVVEAAQLEGRHLVAGPDELPAREVAGRMEMRMAIAQAQEANRLTLSDETSKLVKQVLVDELPEIGPAKGGIYDLVTHPPKAYTPLSQRGGISPELLFGNPTANSALRAAGLFASAADAATTARRVADLYSQDNALGVQSEAARFAGRNVGGWAGGVMTAYALGASAGAGPMVLIAADAAFWATAGEKAVDLWEDKKIYKQKDASGTEWEFTGRAWTRSGMADTTADGVDNPVSTTIAAGYDVARALNCKATNASVDLALKALPPAQNPYRLPANDSDRGSISPADWNRDPADGQWHRTVKVGVSGEGNRGSYMPETASPERAAELDAQAEAVIARNIANSPAAVAARYDLVYHRSGWAADDLERSRAADHAMGNADKLTSWDGQKYERVGEGQWVHDGVPATGNTLLELEKTRSALLPELQRHTDLVNEIKANPPSPEDIGREQTQYRYRMVGTELFPGWQQAIDAAVHRTREEHGLNGGAMALQQDAEGKFSAASPIAHLQIDDDGVRRVVAVTTSEEILLALREANSSDHGEPEVQQAPELKISALTPQQLEAHQQALREANRAGLSMEQVGQAAMLAAGQVGARESGEYSDALDLAASTSHAWRGSTDADAMAAAEAARTAEATRVAESARMASSTEAAIPVEPGSARLNNDAPQIPTPTRPEAEAPHHQTQQREQELARAEQESARQEQAATPTAEAHAPEAQLPRQPTDGAAPARPAHVPDNTAAETQATAAQLHEITQDSSTEAQHVAPVDPITDPSPHNVDEPSKPAAPDTKEVPEHEVSQADEHHDAFLASQLPVYEAHPEEELPAPEMASSADVPEHVLPEPEHAQADEPAPSRLQPSDPAHPANALYRQVREQVEELDQGLGRTYDDTSERLTTSLIVLAKENGLQRVDHVVLSNQVGDQRPGFNVFVVQGELNNPAHRRAVMPTEQAVTTPHEESLERLDVLLERDMQQEQQANLQRQQDRERIDEQHAMAMVMGGGGGGGGGG